MRITIQQGRLIDPHNKLDTKQDLFIADGKFVAIDKQPKDFSADMSIDANNKIVIPGVVDICARLREPGQLYKGSFKTELPAANKGGVTSICCPPDTKPVIDTTAVVDLIQQRMHNINCANVFPLAALTQGLAGEQLAEMETLKRAGCIGVSNAYSPIINNEVLRRSFEYAASCDLTVFYCPEDQALKNNGVIHEGALSTRMGLPAIPETAETVAVSKAILLAEQSRTRIHFGRLSSARSVRLIREAKQQGLAVSADVAITHLLLTDMDVADFNSLCHLQPPLRSETDRLALIEGINDGTIDAICSDHQPHDSDAKSAPFSLTEPGASTIEFLLPLVMHLVDQGSLKMDRAIAALTKNPATIMRINKGALTPEYDADICIVDAAAITVVNNKNLLSKGKNTPFNGWEIQGAVQSTFYKGRQVYQQD